MKAHLMKRARKWSLYGGLVAAMVYASLTLNSEPAHAGQCTQSECGKDALTCTNFCSPHGGILQFACPFNGENYFCSCKVHGYVYSLPC
jgi:hypothetical protein